MLWYRILAHSEINEKELLFIYKFIYINHKKKMHGFNNISNTIIVMIIIALNIKFSQSSLYYDLHQSKPKCFVEEVFDNTTVLLLKWKIFSQIPLQPSDMNNVLQNILFYVYDEETSKLIFKHTPTSEKSKTTFLPKKTGQYRICSSFKATFRDKKVKIQMNLKISSEIGYELQDIRNAIKAEDINKINNEMLNIASKLKPIIESQKEELKEEKKSAEETIKSTKWYKALTFIQIAISFTVGIVQLNNFRKFLTNSHII